MRFVDFLSFCEREMTFVTNCLFSFYQATLLPTPPPKMGVYFQKRIIGCCLLESVSSFLKRMNFISSISLTRTPSRVVRCAGPSPQQASREPIYIYFCKMFHHGYPGEPYCFRLVRLKMSEIFVKGR